MEKSILACPYIRKAIRGKTFSCLFVADNVDKGYIYRHITIYLAPSPSYVCIYLHTLFSRGRKKALRE